MTAIQWLKDQYMKADEPAEVLKILLAFEEAIKLEKQQIIDAYNKSFELRDKPYSTAEKYYQETFKKD